LDGIERWQHASGVRQRDAMPRPVDPHAKGMHRRQTQKKGDQRSPEIAFAREKRYVDRATPA
jgi:hypothetical protein